jgi:hypothetical protein
VSTNTKTTKTDDTTVPAQAAKENVVTLTAAEEPVSKVDRVKALFANKRVIAGLGAAAVLATVAIVKYTRASGDEDETTTDDTEQPTAA